MIITNVIKLQQLYKGRYDKRKYAQVYANINVNININRLDKINIM